MVNRGSPYGAREGLERLLALLKRTKRFWRVAFVVTGIGMMVSLAVAFLKARVFMSETLILYREGIRSSDLGGPDEAGDPARKLGLRLREMVLSRTRLQQIIEEFKLYPVIVEHRGGYVEAVDEMRKDIAFRVKDSDTFGLSYQGENPERVQQVTARLAEVLIEENSKSRSEQAEVTRQFLDAEAKQSERDLRQKETQMAQFLAKHPEFAMDVTAQTGVTTPTGVSIRAATAKTNAPKQTDPALVPLEREALRLQARLGMQIPKRELATADPKLAAARGEAEQALQSAMRDLAEKQSNFTEQHPDVRAAKARVAVAEAKLKRIVEESATVAPAPTPEGGLQTPAWAEDRTALQAQLQKVRAEIAAYKAKKERNEDTPTSGSNWIVALETEWARLSRELAEARQRYQQVEDKKFRAALTARSAETGSNAQMVIVDPAFKPTHPIKAGRTVIAGVGGAASIFIAFMIAFLCALLDHHIYERHDLERLGVAPLLVVVPSGKLPKGKRNG